MVEAISLPSYLIADLYQSYQSMAEAALRVKSAIRSDGEEYAIVVPKYGETEADTHSNGAREAAIKSITQLYLAQEEEMIVDAGLLCASPATVKEVLAFNDSKKLFKKAVLAIRDYRKAKEIPGQRITSLINDEIKHEGFRSPELKHAMKTARISALDLKRCYAQIRITEPKLDVFSWTWATQHNRLKKMTVAEAEKKLNDMLQDNPAKLEKNLKMLAQCAPDEELVSKVELNNQLRANYGYWDGDTVKRKSCPISGIVIAQQKTLPRYLWRDDPATTGQITQQVSRVSDIEETVFIEPLKLHRYVR